MAKQRKGQRPPRAAKPRSSRGIVREPVTAAPTRAPAPSAPTPVAPAPVFWFGFEVTWTKLALARVVLFTLLALDAFLAIRHAPRYGAGGFNVGHAGFLSELAPGRVGYGVAQLALAYAFVLTAFGVAARVLVPAAAAIYAWLYFTSQLDSYQHHYLVAIVLAIASFVPWQRPADATPSTPVRTWAVRLVLVQLGIMYLWAAISKLDAAWLDGRTLATQLSGALASTITSTVGFQVVAIAVVAAELVLAATVWTRRAWVLAAPLGIAFHLGILATGLEVGLFAYLMLGLYVLVVPDRVWVALLGGLVRAGGRLARGSWSAWAVGVAAALALAWLVRIEHAFGVALAATAVAIALAVHARLRGHTPRAAIGAGALAAIALWVIADRATDVAVDYCRFWGGAQRRLGDLAQSEHAYRRLVEVAPDGENGHYQLGRVLILRGRGDEALAHLHAAQRLAPAKARAFVEEARYLSAQGKTAEARAKAQQATHADPSHAGARALLDSLSGGAVAPPATDEPE